MNLVQRLDPPIPVHTPFGDGNAWLFHQMAADQDQMWEVILNHNGANIQVPNYKIRMANNWSLGRRVDNIRAAITQEEDVTNGNKNRASNRSCRRKRLSRKSR